MLSLLHWKKYDLLRVQEGVGGREEAVNLVDRDRVLEEVLGGVPLAQNWEDGWVCLVTIRWVSGFAITCGHPKLTVFSPTGLGL